MLNSANPFAYLTVLQKRPGGWQRDQRDGCPKIAANRRSIKSLRPAPETKFQPLGAVVLIGVVTADAKTSPRLAVFLSQELHSQARTGSPSDVTHPIRAQTPKRSLKQKRVMPSALTRFRNEQGDPGLISHDIACTLIRAPLKHGS